MELLSVYFEESAAHQWRKNREKPKTPRSDLQYDLELTETEKDLIDHYEDDNDYGDSESGDTNRPPRLR
jgi:hypothetical protein